MLTMEVHDYEYYEAHAKDVKLEDITSSQKNEDILAMVRDNDPEQTFFNIDTEEDDCDFVVREGDHLGWLGHFVGRSQKLKSVYIGDSNNINLNEFLRGIGHNRSIQTLELRADLGESFQSLIPFLRNNDSLRHLGFGGFDIGLQCARNIALLLGQHSSCKRLNFEDAELDDEVFVEIVTALKSQPQIEELRLHSNNIIRDGYVALGKALEGCLNLRKLELTVNNDIGDEGLHLSALAEGLRYCHDIRELVLCGVQMFTEEGLRSLSSLFQSDNCRLERLLLNEMNLDDVGMAVLAPGLASVPSLKRLYLESNPIGDRGLQDLARCLVNCNLEELDLSGNTLMNSVSGLRALGTLVGKTTNMKFLNLSRSYLTDEGLQSFVQGMANCSNLTELSLQYNRSITANGLASLSSLLRAKCCNLSKLDLHGINIGDDGAAALANGLIGNSSLTNLQFYVSRVTSRGWDSFSMLLCDTSSVNNTYLSNHILVHIGDFLMQDTPEDIKQYLKWNKLQNHTAAICKILHSHPNIEAAPLFQFDLGCLPLLVEWFEEANSYIDKVNESSEAFQSRELSAVYQFIRGMPLLAANGYRRQKKKVELKSKSKKRKLDQTL